MHASAEHLSNVLGTFGLAVADDLVQAVLAVARGPVSVPAAVSFIGSWGAGSSVDALARALGVTHSRAVRVADRLQADGLVRRERSTVDLREVLLHPTARGRRLALRVQAERAAALEAWLTPLDVAERTQLGSLVDKMLAARAGATLVPTHACRLCDTGGCGHPESCPVSLGASNGVPGGLPELSVGAE